MQRYPWIVHTELNLLGRIVGIDLPGVDLHFIRISDGVALSSTGVLNRSLGATGLRSNVACPSQGSSTSRTRAKTGPTGPLVVRTRSMSCEYRIGTVKCGLD